MAHFSCTKKFAKQNADWRVLLGAERTSYRAEETVESTALLQRRQRNPNITTTPPAMVRNTRRMTHLAVGLLQEATPLHEDAPGGVVLPRVQLVRTHEKLPQKAWGCRKAHTVA